MALIYSIRRAETAVFPRWRKRTASADQAAIAGVVLMFLLFACAVAATVFFSNT